MSAEDRTAALGSDGDMHSGILCEFSEPEVAGEDEEPAATR